MIYYLFVMIVDVQRTVFLLRHAALVLAFALSAPVQGQCEVAQVMGADDGDPDLFGRAVAIDGDLAVVGDSASYPEDFSEVYVYRRMRNEWVKEAVLTPDVPEQGDIFGTAVAICDGTIVVGATGRDLGGHEQGAVFVFNSEGGVWSQTASLQASNSGDSYFFGNAVAIDGDVIVVGAASASCPGASDAGSAYVFRRRGHVWVEETMLTACIPNQGFGYSVAIHSDVILIGTGWIDPGLAYLYRRSSTGWILEDKLRPSLVESESQLRGVAIQGDVAILGAPFVDGDKGAVFVFEREPRRERPATRNNSNDINPGLEQTTAWRWVQTARLSTASSSGPQPFFGASVALSRGEQTMLVGAPLDGAAAFWGGAVYVFRLLGSTWSETAQLTASDAESGDQFGAIAMDGDTAVVGAPGSSGTPGTAYFFSGMMGLDCNGNGQSDSCDIFLGTSEDGNGDGIPDECLQSSADWNADGLIDLSDVLEVLAALDQPPRNGSPDSVLADLIEVLLAFDRAHRDKGD